MDPALPTAPPAPATSYRELIAVPGFAALALSATLSRTANRMWEVGLVLYVLERFHSASLAGLTVFLSIAPGLLLSPLAGALLDRHGRRRLIFLDNAVAATALVSIAALGLADVLTSAMLLPICAAASLTFPLSTSGTRSLFPIVIPRPLWDRGNAVDSGSEAVASVAGPALAGAVVALLGGARATLVIAAVFLLAGLAMLTVPEPRSSADRTTPLLRAALAGLRYVVRNRSLRGLALGLSVGNLGYGGLVVLVPVLVSQRMHGGAGTVGALWALQGAGAAVAGLVMGRLGTERRERSLLVGGLGMAVVGFGMLLVPLPALLIAGMLVFGLSFGPVDVAIFSLRQRRTDPAWFGRAFAVSMALNFAGMPLGAAVSGPLVAHTTSGALAVGAAMCTASMLLILLLVPRVDDAAA